MVTELLEFIVNWRTGLILLVAFGFAPGALLRLIVLAFHREDLRRSEMLAELHRVPRLERPLWVVEQLEVALFEGIWERIARRAVHSPRLAVARLNAEEVHRWAAVCENGHVGAKWISKTERSFLPSDVVRNEYPDFCHQDGLRVATKCPKCNNRIICSLDGDAWTAANFCWSCGQRYLWAA